MTRSDLIARACAAFAEDVAVPPPLTLRGGNDVDGYGYPQPFDPALDEPTDEYLERFTFWGVSYLDAQSWRHYLPRLIDYALRHRDDPKMVTDALVSSMRPPDRYPPRLATLSAEQEAVVREFLENIALEDASPGEQADAQQALEEWWWPNPRARPTAAEIAARRAEPVHYRVVGGLGYRLSVPETLTGSEERDIPQESRRVQVWAGDVCGDVHTVVAVNVTSLAVRSLRESVNSWTPRLEQTVAPAPVNVPGARYAERLEGYTRSGSPAEPRLTIMVAAEAWTEVTVLTISTFERDDVRQVVERIAGSLEITAQ